MLLLTSVSYVVVWQLNFGRFDISKTRTSERPKNRNKKLKQKKRGKKYEVSYWAAYNSFNFYCYYMLLYFSTHNSIRTTKHG